MVSVANSTSQTGSYAEIIPCSKPAARRPPRRHIVYALQPWELRWPRNAQGEPMPELSTIPEGPTRVKRRKLVALPGRGTHPEGQGLGDRSRRPQIGPARTPHRAGGQGTAAAQTHRLRPRPTASLQPVLLANAARKRDVLAGYAPHELYPRRHRLAAVVVVRYYEHALHL